MAKKEQDDLIIDVQEAYSKSETFLNENKNVVYGIALILLVTVGGYFGYQNIYLKPQIKKADELIWKAEYYFEVDSLEKAVYGDGNFFGFEHIAENYSSTPAGNLAQYYMGISFMRMGQYQKAIEHLENFDLTDKLVSAIAQGSIGDCYVELGDIDKAIGYFEAAADYNENQLTTPIYLMKAGLAYLKLGKNEDALDKFSEIKENFPKSNEGKNIAKYIAQAGAKS